MAKAAKSAKKAKARPARTASPDSISIPDSESVRVEKISNGFIIEKSGHRGGKYFSDRTYSPKNPVVTVTKEPSRGKA